MEEEKKNWFTRLREFWNSSTGFMVNGILLAAMLVKIGAPMYALLVCAVTAFFYPRIRDMKELMEKREIEDD